MVGTVRELQAQGLITNEQMKKCIKKIQKLERKNKNENDKCGCIL